jgi:hypothetical protein
MLVHRPNVEASKARVRGGVLELQTPGLWEKFEDVGRWFKHQSTEVSKHQSFPC